MSYDVSRTVAMLFFTVTALSFVFAVNLLQQVFLRPTLADVALLMLFTVIFGGSLAFTKITLEARKEVEQDA